jgi:16S rRNA (cytidine1402-2'-O)-methyltransferase
MPLNLSEDGRKKYVLPGHLYVVATPIGHLEDITLRALGVLRQADLLAAEDTRHTRILLEYHGIKRQMVPYHEHNEVQQTKVLIGRLQSGSSVALVSNAGTPTMSDPGYRVVRAAVENDIPVVPIPGACAAITALSASGMPTDAFVFMGFLDKKKQRRMEQIGQIKIEPKTVILYESPRRVSFLISELIDALGRERGVVLCRELTKIFEEVLRGSLGSVQEILLDRREIRGECVLLISGAEKEPVPIETLHTEIRSMFKTSNEKPTVLSRMIADKLGLPRSVVYQEILRLSKDI